MQQLRRSSWCVVCCARVGDAPRVGVADRTHAPSQVTCSLTALATRPDCDIVSMAYHWITRPTARCETAPQPTRLTSDFSTTSPSRCCPTQPLLCHSTPTAIFVNNGINCLSYGSRVRTRRRHATVSRRAKEKKMECIRGVD